MNPSPLALMPLPPPPPGSSAEQKRRLPLHWKEAKDSAGKAYYYHSITRKTQWELPTEQDEGTITMDLATPDHSPEKASHVTWNYSPCNQKEGKSQASVHST